MLKFLSAKKELSFRPYPKGNPQILDLLHLSRKEKEHREYFLMHKKRLQALKELHEKETDPYKRSHLRFEREVLRRKAEQSVTLYRIVKRERVRLFRDYIAKLPLQTKEIYAAEQ